MTNTDRKTPSAGKMARERGDVDDWEALALVLLDNPPLKARALARLRQLRTKEPDRKTYKITAKDREQINTESDRRKR